MEIWKCPYLNPASAGRSGHWSRGAGRDVHLYRVCNTAAAAGHKYEQHEANIRPLSHAVGPPVATAALV